MKPPMATVRQFAFSSLGRGRAAWLLLSLCCCSLLGCAASSPKNAAPAQSEAPGAPLVFSSLEDAEAALRKAEQQVLASAPQAQYTAAPAKPSPETAPPAPTEPTVTGAAAPDKKPQVASGGAPPRAQVVTADDGASKDEAESASPCQLGCKALASMQRAAEAICRMTAEQDERCSSARQRVADSAARLAHCACEQP